MNGKKVIVADHRVGQHMAQDDDPVGDAERARRPHIIEIPRSQESARTTSTRPIHQNNSISPSSHQKLGSTKLAMMINE